MDKHFPKAVYDDWLIWYSLPPAGGITRLSQKRAMILARAIRHQRINMTFFKPILGQNPWEFHPPSSYDLHHPTKFYQPF